jgi:hypothetical protein
MRCCIDLNEEADIYRFRVPRLRAAATMMGHQQSLIAQFLEITAC